MELAYHKEKATYLVLLLLLQIIMMALEFSVAVTADIPESEPQFHDYQGGFADVTHGRSGIIVEPAKV